MAHDCPFFDGRKFPFDSVATRLHTYHSISLSHFPSEQHGNFLMT